MLHGLHRPTHNGVGESGTGRQQYAELAKPQCLLPDSPAEPVSLSLRRLSMSSCPRVEPRSNITASPNPTTASVPFPRSTATRWLWPESKPLQPAVDAAHPSMLASRVGALQYPVLSTTLDAANDTQRSTPTSFSKT